MSDLTEKTKISLFAVLTALPFLVGVAFWLASIDAKASSASEEVRGLRNLILDVRERTIRIEQHQRDHDR